MIDYNQLAADYARHRQVQPEVLRALLAGSASGTASRVLEVGCGTGNYSIAIETALGCDCAGIDPSEQMLVRAASRCSRVRFLQGRAEQLDFPADSFDLVFSVDVIHHVGDRAGYFREATRVLRPGGRLCTVTDSEWIIRNRRPLAAYFPETIEAELRRYPPIPLLKDEMAAAGFDSISEEMVEFAYVLDDCQVYRDKAYSALHIIPPEAFERGIRRMEQDLQAGPIPCVSRYVLVWGKKD